MLRKLTIVMIITGIFLLSGCGQSPNLYKRDVVVQSVGNDYYHIPKNATYVKLDKNHNLPKIGTCKKRSLLVFSDGTILQKLIQSISNEARFIKEGKLLCLPPVSYRQAQKYRTEKARRDRINNDPRVIAARIQANNVQVARDQQSYSDSLKDFNRNMNSIINANTPRTVNVYHHRGY